MKPACCRRWRLAGSPRARFPTATRRERSGRGCCSGSAAATGSGCSPRRACWARCSTAPRCRGGRRGERLTGTGAACSNGGRVGRRGSVVNLDRFIVPTTVRTGTAALLAAWLAAWLAGCGPEPEPAAPVEQPGAAEAGEASSLAPGEHAWKTADGNRMPYTVAGRGAATVVLVHCWMCERTFWSEQVPVLARHYRVLALDLPGHGEATAEREAWRVAGFGQDVAELIEGLGLSEVVLVGHSMGGPVSLRAAAIAGDRVRGIVAVDTLHDAEFEYAGE